MGNMVKGNLSIFKGKRVLVTGDTGFKGSWLCLWLKELGADVAGFALPPQRQDDHFNLLKLDRIIHHVDGDIRDLSQLIKISREFQPEFLFHLAAQSIVRFSYKDPKVTFDTNVCGSVNILEIARMSDTLRSLIYVTSDKCYKNKEWIWGYRENDELGGRDPYSASKSAAEIVFSSYMNSFFHEKPILGASSVRAGNVIGGGDWAEDRIVPDCIKSLQAKQRVELRNPDATRPWQHVLEPVGGYLLLASMLYLRPREYSGAWNFGPGMEAARRVKELAQKIIEHWGEGELDISDIKDAPHEATLLSLNCDKAHTLLGWRPQWSFERSVAETARWYKEVYNGKAASEISRQQIMKYMEACDD